MSNSELSHVVTCRVVPIKHPCTWFRIHSQSLMNHSTFSPVRGVLHFQSSKWSYLVPSMSEYFRNFCKALFWPAPVNHTNGINALEFTQIPPKCFVQTQPETAWVCRMSHIHDQENQRHRKITEADSTNFKPLLSLLRLTTAAYTKENHWKTQQTIMSAEALFCENPPKAKVAPAAAQYTKFIWGSTWQSPSSLSQAQSAGQ